MANQQDENSGIIGAGERVCFSYRLVWLFGFDLRTWLDWILGQVWQL